MNGRVIFLSLFYWPDETERERLEKLQEYFEYYHAELSYQMKTMNTFQQDIYKEASHNNVRNSWRLIDCELREDEAEI